MSVETVLIKLNSEGSTRIDYKIYLKVISYILQLIMVRRLTNEIPKSTDKSDPLCNFVLMGTSRIVGKMENKLEILD